MVRHVHALTLRTPVVRIAAPPTDQSGCAVPSGYEECPCRLGVDSSWVPERPDRPARGRLLVYTGLSQIAGLGTPDATGALLPVYPRPVAQCGPWEWTTPLSRYVDRGPRTSGMNGRSYSTPRTLRLGAQFAGSLAHAMDHTGHEGYDDGVVFLRWVEACRFTLASYLCREHV